MYITQQHCSWLHDWHGGFLAVCNVAALELLCSHGFLCNQVTSMPLCPNLHHVLGVLVAVQHHYLQNLQK